MSNTNFIDGQGTIVADWLNDVNTWAYKTAVNVKAAPYNAKGDGVTDDSAAFQAALNAARDGLKLVIVPYTSAGYVLNSTVSFPGHVANAVNATSINYGVRLLGLGGGGLASRPKIRGQINGFVFDLSGTDLSHVTYSDTIENLDIENDQPVGAGVGCIKLGYVWDCTLKDCRLYSNGINADLGAWTMSSRFVNIRHDGNAANWASGNGVTWSNAAITTAYGSYSGASGNPFFTGAWAVTVEGGSAFYCKYVFRGYGDITQSGRMDIEHCVVIFNFVAEGPYNFDCHIEDFDCLFTNDQTAFPASFGSAGGSGGTGDSIFSFRGSFTGWRGSTSPIVIRTMTSGRQFLNLDDSFNKGGPYTVHNMSGAWNSVIDMTNAGAQPCVVSIRRTSPLPDFSTTGWKPNYGTSRTAKYILIDADTAETAGQFRIMSFQHRLQTQQVLRSNLNGGVALNQTITTGLAYDQTITVTGARPNDFVRAVFLNNAGTGGLPAGVVMSASVTANDTVVVTFANNHGSNATVFGSTTVYVDPHDATTLD